MVQDVHRHVTVVDPIHAIDIPVGVSIQEVSIILSFLFVDP